MKPADGKPRKVIPIAAAPAEKPKTESASLYEAQKKVYPRSISGVFANWRWIMVYVTQLIFYGLPWLQWNGRQAVLFDPTQRRFQIFKVCGRPFFCNAMRHDLRRRQCRSRKSLCPNVNLTTVGGQGFGK